MMIMRDFVTPEERLSLPVVFSLPEEDILVCEGCERTNQELLDDGNTEKEIDDNSVWTSYGSWYCHDDCYNECIGGR